MKKLLLVGVALLAMFASTADARDGGFRHSERGESGERSFVPDVRSFAPYDWDDWGGWYGWNAWNGWNGPYWGYSYGPYAVTPATGRVKLNTDVKDAKVYIDGVYAGTAGKLKSFALSPGSYKIEVRAAGHTPFEQEIYVLAGKTTKLSADLAVQAPSAPEHS